VVESLFFVSVIHAQVIPDHNGERITIKRPASTNRTARRQFQATGQPVSRTQASDAIYNETLQQTFRPLLSKLSNRRQISVIYPHFEDVRGGIEPWLMARWKARAEFLLSVIELLFLSLTVEALQGKMCQNSLPSRGGRSLGTKISGGKGRRPPANILIPLERQLIALQLRR